MRSTMHAWALENDMTSLYQDLKGVINLLNDSNINKNVKLGTGWKKIDINIVHVVTDK